MLALRPNCECCDRDLPPDSRDAMMCSFECTFCKSCAEGVLKGKCPNCRGEPVRRPVRPAERLAKFPASTERKVKTGGCKAAYGLPLMPAKAGIQFFLFLALGFRFRGDERVRDATRSGATAAHNRLTAPQRSLAG